MRNNSDEEQWRNLSVFERIDRHWKIDSSIRPLSSDRRDEVLELVQFCIDLQQDNLKGQSELLTRVRSLLNNYLKLVVQVRQKCIISQPTSISDMLPWKLFEHASTSHSKIEKLTRDQFDNIVEVATFLQGKQLNNLDKVEKILNSWLCKAMN